MSLLIKP